MCQGNGVSSENHLPSTRMNDPDNPLARKVDDVYNTHIKSRVEAAPEVELFPYILDNTRGCSTTLIKGEPYAEISLVLQLLNYKNHINTLTA